jgi:hypothetical protein
MSAFEYKYKIGVRRFGYVNWIGFYTLYLKEVQRFFKVWVQTIVSPIVTLLLFFTVFTLAIGSERANVLGHQVYYIFSTRINCNADYAKCICQHFIFFNDLQGSR